MNPRQIQAIPEGRRAQAPYNFVELPEQPIPAESLPDACRYHPDRHTGIIRCTLETASALYVRCGLSPDDYAAFGGKAADELSDDERLKRAAFFAYPSLPRPIIPASTLRGMLRTLVEIAGHGKMERVSDTVRFFFRAVAAMGDDPLKQAYRLGTVAAGYLEEQDGAWYIRPARMDHGATFIWVAETDVVQAHLPGYRAMRRPDYIPQYIEVTFDRVILKQRSRRLFAKGIHPASSSAQNRGILVTSGSMRETGDANQPSPRKNHCIICEPNGTAARLKIDPGAIEDYRSALTPFQRQDPPFDVTMGVLRPGRPIFYSVSRDGKTVTRFGHSPNFRISYQHRGSTRAASAVDFIPSPLRDTDVVDMAEAIFGYVRPTKQDDGQARAGRVFVEDAVCTQQAHEDIWFAGGPDATLTPRILASPKPTTFQHYLVQTSTDQRTLKHYASAPGTETVIRGYKLYWHKGDVEPDQVRANPGDVADAPSQYTSIKPVRSGVTFTFALRFENLTDAELGALLWVLRIAAEPDYRLSLGMGKPYGLGAVRITHTLHLTNRGWDASTVRRRELWRGRYTNLFATGATAWETGERAVSIEEEGGYVSAFEGYVLRGIGADPKSALRDQPRIRQLLALLRWPGPMLEETRYMTIEPNEYRNRPILPDPSDLNMAQANVTQSAPTGTPTRHDSPEVVTPRQPQEATTSRPSTPVPGPDRGDAGRLPADPERPQRAGAESRGQSDGDGQSSGTPARQRPAGQGPPADESTGQHDKAAGQLQKPEVALDPAIPVGGDAEIMGEKLRALGLLSSGASGDTASTRRSSSSVVKHGAPVKGTILKVDEKRTGLRITVRLHTADQEELSVDLPVALSYGARPEVGQVTEVRVEEVGPHNRVTRISKKR